MKNRQLKMLRNAAMKVRLPPPPLPPIADSFVLASLAASSLSNVTNARYLRATLRWLLLHPLPTGASISLALYTLKFICVKRIRVHRYTPLYTTICPLGSFN